MILQAVKESHFIAYKEDPNFIYDITTQFSPSFLKCKNYHRLLM